MKRILLIVSGIMLACLTLGGHAEAQVLFGESCTNLSGTASCGIGNDIVLTSIKCYVLNNNNPNDTTIPCQTSLAAYGTLPGTYDPTQLVFKFTTNHASYAEVRGGAFGVTDTIWVDPAVGTSHTVIVNHVGPGAGAKSAALPDYVYYVAACQHAFPCNNADGTWSSYPGPTGTVTTGGGHSFVIVSPNAAPSLPASWEINYMGHMPAWQGSFATVPLIAFQKTGRFQTLPGSASTNNVAQQGSTGGLFYYWNGSTWVQTTPVWYLTTLTLTIGATTYTCHPDAQGNHTPYPVVVENTCTNGAADSGIALVVYYTGQFGSQSQDYRPIQFDSSVGQYYITVSSTNAPPSEPTSKITLEVYAGNTAITGNATANVSFTLYRGTDHVAAAPPTSISLNVPVQIRPVQVLNPDPPPSFSADSGILGYERWAAQSGIRECFNTAQPWSLLYWLKAINTGTWWEIGPPGDWGETQSWLYDQGRTYQEIKEQFTQMMNGGSWGDWTDSNTFGDSYAHLIIKPTTNNPGGYYYMAMNSGTKGGSQPTWSSHTSIGSTFTDNGISWMVLGNQASWEACVVYAQNPYAFAVVTNGAQSTGEFSRYAGGSLRSFYQTGDAFAQDGAFKAGMYSHTVIDLSCVDSSSAECQVDHGSIGLPNFMTVFSHDAGRLQSHHLEALAMRWRLEHSLGTDSNFTNSQILKRAWKLAINANINYLYYLIGQSNVATLNPFDNLEPHSDSFYYGIIENSLIVAYDTDKLLDPTNSLDLLDPRIPQAIKDTTDYLDANWFDQPFSQQGIHTYSIGGFTPHDLMTVQGLGGVGGTTNAFFNELGGFMVAPSSWLYAYCGNSCTGPGAQGYDTISDLFRLGALSSYHCSTSWFCTTFSDGLWLHSWSGATGTPKQLAMSYRTALANDENWRNGYRMWSELDIDPGRNPCRDGSNGANPCASGHRSPYADVMPAYPFEFFSGITQTQGAPRFNGTPYNQVDPTDCTVPCRFSGYTASPVSNITSTGFTVTEFTAEQSTMTVSYGTTTACSTGIASTEDPGFPQLLRLTTADVWQHQFTIGGLSPSTNYYMKFNTRDLAGNTFSTNCDVTPGNISGGGLNVTTLTQTTLTISTASLPNGTVNVPYNQTLTAIGGVPPYTWFLPQGTLPPPLQLGASTGAITGTPTTPGSYPFTVQVDDSAQHNFQASFTIGIAGKLQISPTSCPAGAVGQAYSCTLTATLGQAPYIWTAIGLPAGITGTANGSSQFVLSGIPTTAGTKPVTISVHDSHSPAPWTANGLYTITINNGLFYTTHLSTETGNNTSASAQFNGGTNGNEAPANISKVDVHSLLYPTNTTYTYAHLEPWFCNTNGAGNVCNGHIYTGYNSNDATQVAAQVTDMMSRGMNGLVIDYYGKAYGTVTSGCPQGTSHCIEDQSSLKVAAYVASQCTSSCPFTMHLMEDYGSFSGRCLTAWASYGYASQQACVIGVLEIDLSWMNQNFWAQQGYLKSGTSPIVGVFDYDSEYTSTNFTTVWNTVQTYANGLSNAGSGVIFYFENNGGFTHTASGGAFAWVQINTNNPNDFAKNYLDSFYTLGKTKPSEITFGGSWSGFNDSLASWGTDRIMNQNCGQTLLSTTSEAGNYYNASTQLPYMEFVTWNDYDEGSEMETGINPCNTISGITLAGSTLSWTSSGDVSTVDHYTVYVTSDTTTDPQLAVLQDEIDPTQLSLDISNFPLPAGTYYLYLKMVSKPMMKNNISSRGGPFVVSGGGGQQNARTITDVWTTVDVPVGRDLGPPRLILIH